MPAFEYTAITSDGDDTQGVIEGDSPRQIRQQLRNSGLIPMTVNEVSKQEKHHRPKLSFKKAVNHTELTLITRQLATLLEAGLPIEQALHDISQQTRNYYLQTILHAVRSNVNEGHSLADSLAEYPDVFPDLYQKTVDAGEQSGHLHIVLERLADHSEKQQQLRQKIQLALFYPAILTIIAFLVVTLLMTYVVPRVIRVFETTGQDLPAITHLLINVSDYLRSYGLLILLILFVALVIFRKLLKNPVARQNWHRFLLWLPLVGNIIRSVNTARFSRTLSILVASTVPILEALRISSQLLSNLPMRKAVEDASIHVREGSSLRDALEQTGYFPNITLSLIGSGESSGKLDTMLDRAADTHERDVEATLSIVLSLFEPLLILLMGGVVLIIVLAILLPIFELNQLVN
ncbi:MAG: type II secretion system inner membrane protein GspF [Thioalkalispiraceae bacterium]|jgi:general secretion pathway protein F